MATTVSRYFSLREAAPIYPHKTIRRLTPRNRKWGAQRPAPAPPSLELPAAPSFEEATLAAAAQPQGVSSLLRTARRSNAEGDHGSAFYSSRLAAAASPHDLDVLEAAAFAQREALLGSLLLCWRDATADCAAREERDAARGASRVAKLALRRASSVPKPRQGYTKPVLRALCVRLCSACRALRPRALMWRCLLLRPPQPAPAQPKPRPSRTVLRHRVRAVKAPPTRPAEAAPAPDAPPPGVPPPLPPARVLLQRLPRGASAALQTDELVWTSQASGARSAYVCRCTQCVSFAVKRKALTRSLGAPVPAPLLHALVAATALEEQALREGQPEPGVSHSRAAQIALLRPRIAPLAPSLLRGPHDKWEAPPQGPK